MVYEFTSYRISVNFLDRRAMSGLANMLVDFDTQNPEFPFFIKCLKAFSYKDQIYPFLEEYEGK